MALGQRRMVYTSLWQNPEFGALSDGAKLLYIGMITVADDDGRLRGNSHLLRSQVFPFDEKVSIENVRKWINDIVRSKLVTFYKVKNEYYIQHPNWEKYQYIRPDLYKKSKIPTLRKRNEKVTKSLPKLSKDNIREERIENSPEFLKNIPENDMQDFLKRFDASRKMIISKAEDLIFWLESNGKTKKNYRSFLLNALKKDFPERSSIPVAPAPNKHDEITEEGRQERMQHLKKVKEELINKGVLKK